MPQGCRVASGTCPPLAPGRAQAAPSPPGVAGGKQAGRSGRAAGTGSGPRTGGVGSAAAASWKPLMHQPTLQSCKCPPGFGCPSQNFLGKPLLSTQNPTPGSLRQLPALSSLFTTKSLCAGPQAGSREHNPGPACTPTPHSTSSQCSSPQHPEKEQLAALAPALSIRSCWVTQGTAWRPCACFFILASPRSSEELMRWGTVWGLNVEPLTYSHN